LYEEYELVPHQLIPPLCELLNFSPWRYLTGEQECPEAVYRDLRDLANETTNY